jgi:hypothetical protein
MTDSQELTDDEITKLVISAFAPNHCEVKVELRAKLTCVVFDINKKGHSEKFMVHELGNRRTRDALDEILQIWREILVKLGYKFD